MTPSKQSSTNRCPSVMSTLTRCIDTGSLRCALNAWTKSIYKKLDLRQKIYANQSKKQVTDF